MVSGVLTISANVLWCLPSRNYLTINFLTLLWKSLHDQGSHVFPIMHLKWWHHQWHHHQTFSEISLKFRYYFQCQFNIKPIQTSSSLGLIHLLLCPLIYGTGTCTLLACLNNIHWELLYYPPGQWLRSDCMANLSLCWAQSFSPWRYFASLAIQNAPSEDSHQTAWVCRLIWIFAGHTCPKVLKLWGFSCFCAFY